MGDIELPRSLIEALRDHKVIPFAGAGVSMAVRRKRDNSPAFPSWIELLRKAATKLREEQRQADANYVEAVLAVDPPKLLDAAQHAKNSLHSSLWSDLLVECFRIKKDAVAPDSLAAARALWRLGSGLLITTNYDNVLHWSAPDGSDPIRWPIQVSHGLAEFRAGHHSDQTIWHLHGHIDDPERLVLTPDGYTALYGSGLDQAQYSSALDSFRSLLVSHTIVFIGFSLADEALNDQLRWLEQTFRGQAGKHYALVRQSQIPLVKARTDLVNVEPLGFADFGAPLLRLLEQMGEAAGTQQTRRAIAALEPAARAALIAVPQLEWPGDLGLDIPDSLLLRADSGIVPFHPERRKRLQTILDWALGEFPPISLRLEAGPGGSGKTRLLIEVCRELAARNNWSVGFLQPSEHLDRDFRQLLAVGKNCLVVVDYAETRIPQVVALARTALNSPRPGRVRIALIARDGGDWWDHLANRAEGDKVLEALLREPRTKLGPYRLGEMPVPVEARADIFTRAFKAFASCKNISASVPTIPDLSGALFGELLYIHIAALAVLRGRTWVNDRELLQITLGRERAYWRHLLAEERLGDSCLEGVEQGMALLTLVGGTRTAKGAREILARTPRLRHLPPMLRDQLFTRLRQLYRREGGIDGLRPDLLGEHLVAEALTADDELLDLAIGGDSSPTNSRQALTVLTRLARHAPAERRWLRAALERHIPERLDEAFEVGIETGAPLPEILAEVISTARGSTRLAVVNDLRPKLPKETANLGILSMQVARLHISLVEAKGRPTGRKHAARLVAAYENLESRLRALGDFKQAAEASRQAVRWARQIAMSRSDADRAALARMLGNTGFALSDIGEHSTRDSPDGSRPWHRRCSYDRGRST